MQFCTGPAIVITLLPACTYVDSVTKYVTTTRWKYATSRQEHSPPFVIPENSLSCPQEHVSGSYGVPVQSNRHPQTLIFVISFLISSYHVRLFLPSVRLIF
jgi:hypothetical protein